MLTLQDVDDGENDDDDDDEEEEEDEDEDDSPDGQGCPPVVHELSWTSWREPYVHDHENLCKPFCIQL